MQDYFSIDGYFLIAAASHAVVSAFYYGVACGIGEACGTIFCIIHGRPYTRGGFDAGLVTIRIEFGEDRGSLIFLNGGVLIQRVGNIRGCHSVGVILRSCGATA